MYLQLLVLVFVYPYFVSCSSNSQQLPQWSPVSTKAATCPLDSPEIFFVKVYDNELKSLLNEGRAFFGSLLEALEGSLDDDLKSSLEESWIETSEDILSGQEFHGDRIIMLWNLLTDRWEGGKLPWEQGLKNSLIVELLTAIGSEHLELQHVFSNGLQAILKPIQPHVANTLKKIQAELVASGDISKEDLPEQLGRIMEEVEPTFVGKLLVALVRRDTTGLSFLGRLLEEVAIVIEAFRQQASHHSFFWKEMSEVFARRAPSEEEIIHKYVNSHAEIITSLLQILQDSK